MRQRTNTNSRLNTRNIKVPISEWRVPDAVIKAPQRAVPTIVPKLAAVRNSPLAKSGASGAALEIMYYHRPPVYTGEQEGHDRRGGGNDKRKHAYSPARLRNRHPESIGYLRDDTHNAHFGIDDAENTERQNQYLPIA